MELTTNSIATSRSSDIFGNRTKFSTFLRMEGRLDLKRSLKQKLPYLETSSESAIWFGESVKKIMKTMTDIDFAKFLRDNAHTFSLGLLLVDRKGVKIPVSEQRWVIFINNSSETIATITWDEDGGETVGTV